MCKYQNRRRTLRAKTKGYTLGVIAVFIFLHVLISDSVAAKPSITIHNIIDLTGAYARSPSLRKKEARIIFRGSPTRGDWMSTAMGRPTWRSSTPGPNSECRCPVHVGLQAVQDGEAPAHHHRNVVLPQPGDDETVLERDNIVCYGIGFSDPQLYPPAWNYMDCWSYGESAAGAIEYYVDQIWPKRGKGARPRWPTSPGIRLTVVQPTNPRKDTGRRQESTRWWRNDSAP